MKHVQAVLSCLVLFCMPGFVAGVAFAQDAAIEATTASGDKVRLHANGRWEYVDAQKAEAQKPVVQAHDEREAAAQGGLFGIGRKIYPGDPDYNRGSMSGKGR